MNSLMTSLIATDDLSRLFGSGLHPRLRAAIEADLRFPAHAAAPCPIDPIATADLPANTVQLHPAASNATQRTPK